MAKPKNDGSDQPITPQALRVLHDAQLERGEHPIGKKLHLSTVTHGWRGVLYAVSETHYYLEPGTAVMCNGTGKIAEYASTVKGDEESPILTASVIIRVPRGAVAWEMYWP